MTLPQGLLEPDVNAAGIAAAAFAAATVTLTKQEHVQLVMDVAYWRTQFNRRVARDAHRERSYRRFFDQLKEHSATREVVLIAELELAQAKIRELQQRVFGRKTERGRCVSERAARPAKTRAPRGQRPGSAGHGRTMQTELPRRSERVELDTPQCPQCGLELGVFPGTEDSEVLEIEVQAYRRVIRRQRYHPRCTCGCVPGIVSAPAPARLIERGKFGVSVWTTVLLDKFLYGRPSHRLIEDLAGHGLQISPGTVAGGLQAIAPLFEPLDRALALKLRSQSHWHADETRWAVFVDAPGKVGHRWYLWVFHSSAVVHYVLDESRSTEVIEGELAGVEDGVISCDRYSAYKKFARLHPGVVLAFCWAHQRRDFLELAQAYPACEPWAFEWIEAIGQLYHLNQLRLQALPDSAPRGAAQAALREAVQNLAEQRERALADPHLNAPERKVLQSMAEHWSGLTVFVDAPWVPMDNNAAERDLRSPVVGRKNFYGSGAPWAGQLAATMYGVLATLGLWSINARAWLGAYLQACADNGNRVPVDLAPFLPWTMDEARLAALRAVPTGAGAHAEVFDTS